MITALPRGVPQTEFTAASPALTALAAVLLLFLLHGAVTSLRDRSRAVEGLMPVTAAAAFLLLLHTAASVLSVHSPARQALPVLGAVWLLALLVAQILLLRYLHGLLEGRQGAHSAGALERLDLGMLAVALLHCALAITVGPEPSGGHGFLSGLLFGFLSPPPDGLVPETVLVWAVYPAARLQWVFWKSLLPLMRPTAGSRLIRGMLPPATALLLLLPTADAAVLSGLLPASAGGAAFLLLYLLLYRAALAGLFPRPAELPASEARTAELHRARESLRRETARRKEAEEKLRHTVYHDRLTGLANRELFSEYHQRAFAKFNHRQAQPYAVLFLDLDDFKYVNDTYGHVAGDEMLRETAARLRSCLREVDTVGRIGGDEFVVLIEEVVEPSQTVKVAERIVTAMNRPFSWRGHALELGVSIGIAFVEERHGEPKEVVRDADVALYHAKMQGKNRYSIFQGELQRQAIERMRIERALRNAVQKGAFSLHYQPIIDLNDGRLHGFEALLRWYDPQLGQVSPAEFIPIAEENGLIFAIGRWTLTRACRDMADWLAELPKDGGYTVSVNISPRQLQSEQLLGEVEHALELSSLPAHRLVLEITENAVIPDPESALEILQRLKEMGVQLHLDDFGEGYSSVGLLYRFPFDTMKIDRSYVTGVMSRRANTEVVRTIIDLGHSMNKEVIAEGIEASGEAQVLKSFHCELGQGYFFSHPMPAADVRPFIGSFPSSRDLQN